MNRPLAFSLALALVATTAFAMPVSAEGPSDCVPRPGPIAGPFFPGGYKQIIQIAVQFVIGTAECAQDQLP